MSRSRAAARDAGVPFDRDQIVADRETDQPYAPRRRSDRARGALPVPPPQVRRVRATLAALLQAKTALDAAHRDDTPMRPADRVALLTAVQQHSILLDTLLRRVNQD